MNALVVVTLALALTEPPLTVPGPSTTSPLLAGSYWLEVVIDATTEVPVFGLQHSLTTARSLVTIDAEGWGLQRTCELSTSGPGYRVHPTSLALAAWPVQRYRWEVQGDMVRADPGPLVFASTVDADGDGAPGIGMTLELEFARFELQVASRGHTLYVGRWRDGVVVGVTTVRESRQQVLSGFPFAASEGESPQVVSATFRLVPAAGAKQCAP